jgi:AmiR/NasT family two-component response regulator
MAAVRILVVEDENIIIYLTAHSDERTLERARLTQPSGYLVKPFEDDELQQAIETTLARHHRDTQTPDPSLGRPE